MRIVRKNCMLLIYVKVKELKLPIVVPLPLALVDELLRTLVAVTWLLTGGMRDVRGQRTNLMRWKALKITYGNQRYLGQLGHDLLDPLQKVFPYTGDIEPWRIVATARHFVKEIRSMGSFSLVDVDTPAARVHIKLL